MAYITPNSYVYILYGVPLDKEYNNTLSWADAGSQTLALATLQKYILSAQSYQRVNKNKIRVSILADNLYNCNYLMFQNNAFGSKWFYAFIDQIEYINNNCSEITYTIDVMQTWYFEYELGRCFVEREHSSTDVAGDNIVPENVNIGDSYVINDQVDFNAQYMFGYVLMSKPPNVTQNFMLSGSSYRYKLSLQFNPFTSDLPSGIPLGGYMLYGFPLSQDDASHFLSIRTLYKMQDFRVFNSGGGYDQEVTQFYPLTLSRFLTMLSTGMIKDEQNNTMSMDDVMHVAIYPAVLNLKDYYTNATNAGFGTVDATTLSEIKYVTRPSSFVDDRVSDTYTPKNKKLLTYPYIRMLATNYNGAANTYKFEDFDSSAPRFRWAGTFAHNPTMMLYPCYYRNITNDYLDGIVLTNFPNVQYTGTQYASWMESNKTSFATSLVANAVSNITTAAAGGFNPVHTAMSAVNIGSSIANAVAKVEDIKNAPPTVYGQIANDTLNIATLRPKFTIFTESIKPEYARIIDEYFSMFGYATNRVKVPNIKDSSATLRPYWNYIKTKGCIVLPKDDSNTNGLPGDDITKIAQIYDHGITFWTGVNNVGNYSLDNSL